MLINVALTLNAFTSGMQVAWVLTSVQLKFVHVPTFYPLAAHPLENPGHLIGYEQRQTTGSVQIFLFSSSQTQTYGKKFSRFLTPQLVLAATQLNLNK